MKQYFIFFFILLGVILGRGETIEVPDHYSTIQSAIDSAIDGDEIVVSPGIYYENINFIGKSITLGSLFYTTLDTCYISQTIIDGDQTGSVVIFDNEEDSGSVLCGFTVTNGLSKFDGGGIYIGQECNPTLTNLKILNNTAANMGGGFYCAGFNYSIMNNLLISGNSAYDGAGGYYSYYCELLLEDSEIRDNESTGCGGGIFAGESSIEFKNLLVENNEAEYGGGFCIDGWSGNSILNNVLIQMNNASSNGGGIATCEELYLKNVTITENTASESGGGLYIYWSNVIFSENDLERSSIYMNESESNCGKDIYSHTFQEINLDIFSVQYPTNYYSAPAGNFIWDINNWLIEQINDDLYVSATGNNDNSGTCEESPFKTIDHACAMMAVSEENPHTIYLDSGTYSATSTGEKFPISLLNNTALCGKNKETVILDAEENSEVFKLVDLQNINISGLTITNGLESYGGGIYCHYTGLKLNDLIITANSALCDGGGLYFSNSTSTLQNLLIYGNSAGDDGGGIYSTANGISVLQNVTICDNVAAETGGGLATRSSQPDIINSIFCNNIPNAITCFSYSVRLDMAYSDITGGIDEISVINGDLNLLNGMIYSEPQFIDPANGNYELADNSPCIDSGVSYFEYDGEIWVDLPEEEYWGNSPEMGACEYGVIHYGDINDNKEVESYDAALVLMHTVGMDPLPEDLRPWEEWRFRQGDVDMNNVLSALDCAYILQYVAGIINEFPVIPLERTNYGTITFSNDEDHIYLDSENEIISLYYRVKGSINITPGKAELVKNIGISYWNEDQFAFAAPEGVTGRIIRIPYKTNFGESSVTIDLEVNGNRKTVFYELREEQTPSRLIDSVYPNPFNPETTINFHLAKECDVELTVYNIKGQLLKRLINGKMTAGKHSVNWNGQGCGSGIYFMKLKTNEITEMRKLIMVK